MESVIRTFDWVWNFEHFTGIQKMKPIFHCLTGNLCNFECILKIVFKMSTFGWMSEYLKHAEKMYLMTSMVNFTGNRCGGNSLNKFHGYSIPCDVELLVTLITLKCNFTDIVSRIDCMFLLLWWYFNYMCLTAEQVVKNNYDTRCYTYNHKQWSFMHFIMYFMLSFKKKFTSLLNNKVF